MSAIDLIQDGTDTDIVVNDGEEILDLTDSKATAAPKSTTAKKEETATEDTLPDKYRGKTVAEIAQMHAEAEKLLGRQGAELGELRKLTDAYIKSRLEHDLKGNAPAGTSAQAAKEDDEKVDFFADPEKAIEKVLDKHPKLVSTTQELEALRQEKALSEMAKRHPDYLELGSSAEFLEWVGKSKVRQSLFVAANNYDVDAGDELLTTFKALHPKKQEATATTATTPATDKAAAMKAARTVPNGAVAPSATEASTKKILRRADIIKLMQTDPERYELLQDEIMAAYKEGRVR